MVITNATVDQTKVLFVHLIVMMDMPWYPMSMKVFCAMILLNG